MEKETNSRAKKQLCFANRHMRPEEYALWDVSRKLSYETGVLYFDGRDFANLFERTGKDRVYRAAEGLIKKGWYEVIAPARRDPRTGLFLAAQYRVVSPEEWTALHPHTCVTLPESSPQNPGNESLKPERPVLKTRMTSPQNATYSDKEDFEKEIVKKRESGVSSPQNQTGEIPLPKPSAKPSLSLSDSEAQAAANAASGQDKINPEAERDLHWVCTQILKISLDNDRRIPVLPKTKKVIQGMLAQGYSRKTIQQAAAAVADTLISEKDKIPGLTLADNLADEIEKHREELEEAERQREQRARWKSEMQAQAALEREADERARAEEEAGIEAALASLGEPEAVAVLAE